MHMYEGTWHVQIMQVCARNPRYLACNGSMPHVRPFHVGFLVASAYFHTRLMANIHSKTDEK